MIINVRTLREKLYQTGNLFRYFYALGAFICCYLTLRQLSGRSNEVSESIRIICYILFLCSICKWNTVVMEIKKVFDKPWKKILLLLLEFYGTFAMIGMYFFHTSYSTAVYEKHYPGIIYFAMSFCWIFPIIRYFLSLMIKWGDSISLMKHRVLLKTRFLLIVIMLIPCILFLIAFNPAITSTDSRYCFDSAHKLLWQADFSMLDAHPPFYVFIMGLLLKIYDSVSFLIIIQYVCFALVFVDGILFLYKCGFSKKILGLFYIFTTFGTSNLIMLTTLWRDVPYMISIMWLTLLLIKLVISPDEYKHQWVWCIQFIIAVIFTGFFRQNGLLPALAIIIFLPIAMNFSKKYLILSFISLLLIVGIKGPFYKFLNIEPEPALKFVALSNDLMFSYYTDRPVSKEITDIVNKMSLGDPDNYAYSPYYVRHLSLNEPSGYSVIEFIKIYFENVIRNPKEMISAVILRTSSTWSIIRPRDEPATCVNHLGQLSYPPELQGVYRYPSRVENILTTTLTDLCTWIKDNTVLYLFYWRSGIYNLLIFLITIITFCSHKAKKVLYLLPGIPILAHLLSVFIASAWSDYRIYWASMTISIFLLFFFLYSRRNFIEQSHIQ